MLNPEGVWLVAKCNKFLTFPYSLLYSLVKCCIVGKERHTRFSSIIN